MAAEPLVQAGRLVPVLAAYVDRDPIPLHAARWTLHAVRASARQRLPKVKACVDDWAAWFGGVGAA